MVQDQTHGPFFFFTHFYFPASGHRCRPLFPSIDPMKVQDLFFFLSWSYPTETMIRAAANSSTRIINKTGAVRMVWPLLLSPRRRVCGRNSQGLFCPSLQPEGRRRCPGVTSRARRLGTQTLSSDSTYFAIYRRRNTTIYSSRGISLVW